MQFGGHIHLGEQVQVVVAGAAVGAQASAYAPIDQLGHRRDARGQLHVAFRVVGNLDIVFGQQIHVFLAEHHAVTGQQVGIQDAQVGQVLHRRGAIALLQVGYLALGLGEVDVDDDLIVTEGFTAESGYIAAKNVLNSPEKPTAIMVTTNVIIVGVLEAVFEAGLLIPDDISIVGIADMRATPYLSCPLTAISHPVGQIGKRAFEMLLKRIESPTDNNFEKLVLPSKFIIGNSTQKALGS